MDVLICRVQEQQYAFDLAVVERALLAVATTPLPNAPDFVLGAINVHGSVLPLVSMRKLLGMQPKEIELEDHFILCRAQGKRLALWVDQVKEVRTLSQKELAPHLLPDMQAVQSVFKDDGHIILLYDLEKLMADQKMLW